MVEYKWIRVSGEVHEALRRRGGKGDSFNKIVEGLLDEVKKSD